MPLAVIAHEHIVREHIPVVGRTRAPNGPRRIGTTVPAKLPSLAVLTVLRHKRIPTARRPALRPERNRHVGDRVVKRVDIPGFERRRIADRNSRRSGQNERLPFPAGRHVVTERVVGRGITRARHPEPVVRARRRITRRIRQARGSGEPGADKIPFRRGLCGHDSKRRVTADHRAIRIGHDEPIHTCRFRRHIANEQIGGIGSRDGSAVKGRPVHQVDFIPLPLNGNGSRVRRHGGTDPRHVAGVGLDRGRRLPRDHRIRHHRDNLTLIEVMVEDAQVIDNARRVTAGNTALLPATDDEV